MIWTGRKRNRQSNMITDTKYSSHYEEDDDRILSRGVHAESKDGPATYGKLATPKYWNEELLEQSFRRESDVHPLYPLPYSKWFYELLPANNFNCKFSSNGVIDNCSGEIAIIHTDMRENNKCEKTGESESQENKICLSSARNNQQIGPSLLSGETGSHTMVLSNTYLGEIPLMGNPWQLRKDDKECLVTDDGVIYILIPPESKSIINEAKFSGENDDRRFADEKSKDAMEEYRDSIRFRKNKDCSFDDDSKSDEKKWGKTVGSKQSFREEKDTNNN